ncbi:MAG: Fic family protein [Nitrospirota bacterium]|nr:Fic family protein [Nitrospirota bacterium]
MKLLAQQKGRAGQYIRQVSGYSAFLPTPLPPEPPLQMDDETLALISQADRALGRLDGSIQTLPAPDLFVFMYIRKEAVFSSQIEGTQSSLDDVLEAEARVFNPQRPGDVNEVLNYVKALRFGLERLSELPVSVRLIREIHERLLEGARRMERKPGELRTTQNWIGPAGSTLNEATFIPPPPDAVPQLLGQLESFLHQTDPMPSLIKIGLAHAQFETIHPFLDGNGRMGRLLITFLLCERKILHQPVLYLSHHLKRYRNQYYDLLQNIRDDGNWEDWIKFFLSAVTQVSQEATQTARRIVSLREEHRRIITENFGRTAANGIKVLEQLFSHPIISVNDLAKQTNISFTAANQLMRRFIEHHILTEMTGHTRNRQFRYRPYIDLFADR